MSILKNIVSRIFLFAVLVLTIVFLGWWLFFFVALFYGLLIRRPYELPIMGALLDGLYYFGTSFLSLNLLLIFGGAGLLLAFIIEDRVNWRKLL